MAIVTLDQIRVQLNITDAVDDILLAGKIAAAQGFVERQLGYAIEARFGGEGQPPVPADLAEAVLQLAAWWYENREAANEGGAREMPFGVREIVEGWRDWSF